MVAPKCGACGKEFYPDSDALYYDIPSFARACSCHRCDACGKDFKPDDQEGVTMAPSDDVAEKHGDRAACEFCWATVTLTGKWPKQKARKK